MTKNFRVRARQKPIADIPAWALCCDAVRAIYEQQGLLEVTVIFPSFMAEVECRFRSEERRVGKECRP